MEEDSKILLYASLLHDIGKIIVRTRKVKDGLLKETTDEEVLDYLHDKEYVHAAYSAMIVEKYRDRFKGIDVDKLKELILYHHSEKKKSSLLSKILIISDRLSSATDRSKFKTLKDGTVTDSHLAYSQEVPLINVFSSLNRVCYDGQYFIYPDSADGLKAFKFFPIISLKKLLEDPQKNFSFDLKDTSKWSELYEELGGDFVENFPKNVDEDSMLCWLMNYTFFVPSATPSKPNEGTIPDIPLFTHLKLTSAISLALYKNEDLRKWIEKSSIKDVINSEKKSFSLIAGDVSGIQNFIYTLDTKYAAKFLKVHSLFVQLLSESVALYLLNELGLTKTNLIYCSGGSFYILSQRIDEEKFEGIKEVIYHNVPNETNKMLFVAVSKVDLSPKELKDFRIYRDEIDIFSELTDKLGLEKSKKHRYMGLVFEPRDIVWEPGVGYLMCDVCGREIGMDDARLNEETGELEKLCKFHRNLLKLTNRIKNAKFMSVYVGNEKRPGADLYFRIGDVYVSYVFSSENGIFSINPHIEGTPWERFVFLPIYYPMDGNKIKSLDELCESAYQETGLRKYAILKGDVDSLGHLFRDGFGEFNSFSRESALSFLLDLFFSAIVPKLMAEGRLNGLECKEDKPEQHETIEKRKTDKSMKRPSNLYLIYSGGDDFIITGAWNEVYEFGRKMYEAFREFTAWNPSITLSMSYKLFDPKFKFVWASQECEEELERAKEVRGRSFSEWYESKFERKLRLGEILDSGGKFSDLIDDYREEEQNKLIYQRAEFMRPSYREHVDKGCFLFDYVNFIKYLYPIKNKISVMGSILEFDVVRGRGFREFSYMDEILNGLRCALKGRISKNALYKIYNSSWELSSCISDIKRGKIRIPKIYKLKYSLRKEWKTNEKLLNNIWEVYEGILVDSLMMRGKEINVEVVRTAARLADFYSRKK
ncbi:MAG: type III-A CRISPR-associated protein Cas10/Csm1 [Candidatus Asgardarchaeia archaeon]